MRVAQLVETLDGGGAEALAVGLAGAFAARGDDSHLIVLDGSGPLRGRIAAAVGFHELARPRREQGQLGRLIDFGRTDRALADLLRSLDIEVLQTHLPKANYLGLAVAALRRRRVFPTVHNNREFDYGDSPSRLRGRLRRESYVQMARRCAGMVAVSAQVKASLVAELGLGAELADRIAVVPNGVEIPPAVTQAERAAGRRRWGVGEDEGLLVAVGRLTRQKNYASLVAALARLARQRTDWRCVIAGEGELRADLEARIAAAGLERLVVLAGFLADTRPLLAAADLYCMPSLYEGLPLALLEAMAAGLPVAASDIDGISDVVTDGVEGRLAPVDDADRLADIVGEMLDEPVIRRGMGEAARRLVEQRYGFDAVVERLLAVYEGGRRGGR